MLNRIKNWKSTIIGSLIGLAMFLLIWFEKIPLYEGWIGDLEKILMPVIPVVLGSILKDNNKIKKDKNGKIL